MQQCFGAKFKHTPDIIPSYAFKQDFGDCDLLISAAELPPNWREDFAQNMGSKGWSKNGDVTSIEIQELQFDFISVPLESRQKALTYFAYNDLGNLMGRIAHKLGFKYGHLGLQKVLRDGDHAYGIVTPTDDVADMFDFLGYDYGRWCQGFETLMDIFLFTASSPYFDSDIYLLHNRNAVSRMRDAKRKTYTDFLEWCKHMPSRKLYDVNSPERKEKRHAEFMQKAMERWPLFKQQVEEFEERKRQHEELKTRWNGDHVNTWTGLQGKSLGEFMAQVKAHKDFSAASRNLDSLKSMTLSLFEEHRQK